jgi:hypothetical protein
MLPTPILHEAQYKKKEDPLKQVGITVFEINSQLFGLLI